MNTYNIPRDVKGEGRILFIFSTKALIYSTVGAGVGLVFYFILNLLGLGTIGMIVTVACAFIGFVIATFKVPELGALKATKKISGESIDDVIKRAIKFRQNRKIYVYRKEEEEK